MSATVAQLVAEAEHDLIPRLLDYCRRVDTFRDDLVREHPDDVVEPELIMTRMLTALSEIPDAFHHNDTEGALRGLSEQLGVKLTG